MNRRDLLKAFGLSATAFVLPKGTADAMEQESCKDGSKKSNLWECKTAHFIVAPAQELIFKRPVNPGFTEITFAGHPSGIPDEIGEGEAVILPRWKLTCDQFRKMLVGVLRAASQAYKVPCFHWVNEEGSETPCAFFAGSEQYKWEPDGFPGRSFRSPYFTVLKGKDGSIRHISAKDIEVGDTILDVPEK